MNVWITTKDIEKEDRICMKSPPKEAKVAFQSHSPVSGLSFSNNISVTQVRVNIKETGHDTTFKIF